MRMTVTVIVMVAVGAMLVVMRYCLPALRRWSSAAVLQHLLPTVVRPPIRCDDFHQVRTRRAEVKRIMKAAILVEEVAILMPVDIFIRCQIAGRN